MKAETKRLYSISGLNSLSREEFVRVVGPVFESSPWIADSTWPKRPFNDLQQLHRALSAMVQNADQEKQIALICAHPDLVSRAALAGTLSPESNLEQASAGLNRLTPDEIAAFQQFNLAYRDKFGFPFVICARLNKKDAILEGFRVRLKNSRAEEIKAALGEIEKIAYLRLQDLVPN